MPTSSTWSLPSGFPTKILYTVLITPMHAISLTYFILIYLNTVIISSKQHKLYSSSFCNFLHPPDTSSFFVPNILLNDLFSDTPKM
jgi:hypothetical protein